MSDRPKAAYSFIALVLDDLRRHPLRSAIAVLSIAVALAGATIMIGTSESLENAMISGSAMRKIDLIVLQSGKANPLTSRLNASIAEDLAALDGVRVVQPLLVDSLLLGADRSILVYGWPPDHPDLRKPHAAGNGSLAKGEILIGRTASTLSGLAAGDRIELNLGDFLIAGTFDTDNFYESGVIYMRLDDLQRLIGATGQITFAFVELTATGSADARRKMTEIIKAQDRHLEVLGAEQFFRDNQLSRALRGLGRVILATSLVLSVLIISTIMVLTVSEQRRELAILRAIGWSARRIALLILLETVILAGVSATTGAILAWFGTNAALAYLQNLGFYAQNVVTPALLLLVTATAVLIAVFGAAIPVYHAMGIRVAEALRGQ